MIIDNAEQQRYEVHVGGERAGFVQYRRRPGLIALIHTEIDPRFEGQGLGSELTKGVLDEARAAGIAVLPFCPFANGYIERHSEYASLVPEEFRAEFNLH